MAPVASPEPPRGADDDSRGPEPAEDAGPVGAAPLGRPGRVVLALGAVLLLIAAAATAFSIGRLTVAEASPPADTSIEAGFARDMQTHHDQGVELAFLIRDRSDDEEVRLLAYDIARTQAKQSGILAGWLGAWGLSPAASEPSMTWMTRPVRGGGAGGHGDHEASTHEPGAPMPGLATPEQLDELEAATGAEADRVFLRLMIAHHEGALEMAEAALARSANPLVRTFAEGVVTSQRSEIELMQGMLADRS